MQTKIVINTENGQNAHLTDLVVGELSCIIVDSADPVEFIIQSELGYSLLEIKQHLGTKYYAPRVIVQAPVQDIKHQDQFSKFLLDEKISIIVRGSRNKNVQFIIRMED